MGASADCLWEVLSEVVGTRRRRIWHHVRAIIMLPVVATIVIPVGIALATASANVGRGMDAPLALVLPVVGGTLVAAGAVLVVKTARLFATIGEGTLAPWDPARKLVVEGAYRHVRNPMITGVSCILLGDAVLLGSLPLLVWFGLFLAANAIYIPLVEEPDLEQRFGEPYRVYRENVPRWLPRRSPWDAHQAAASSGPAEEATL